MIVIVIIIITMMMMMMMIMIMIITVASTGVIRDHFTISSLRPELFPTRTLKWPGRNRVQITCNTLGARHMQYIVCHKGTVQPLSLAVLIMHLF